MDVKCTIIVPVYKSEDVLQYCLDSIICQTYKNTEILLIDDSSPDQSAAVSDSVAASDERVIIVHKSSNGGVSRARNTGLTLATGDYLTFVDNDDILVPQAVEHMVDSAVCEKADVVVCKSAVIESYSESSVDGSTNNKELVYKRYFFANRDDYVDFNFVYVWGKLYRTDLAKKAYFPAGHLAEDLYFNTLVLLNERVNRILLNDITIYYYYANPNSVTHNLNRNRVSHYIDMHQEIYSIVRASTNNIEMKRVYIEQYFESFLWFRDRLAYFGGGLSPRQIRRSLYCLKDLWFGRTRLRRKLRYTLIYCIPSIY